MAKAPFNQADLVFLPLGGSGEIGMNLNLYGCDGKWIIVDCGITFADPYYPGVDIVLPDHSFIRDRRDDLLGIVLTHGHEDHIGAVAHLWPDLQCPVFATPFTAALVRDKFEEAGIDNQVPLHIVPNGGSVDLDPFQVTYIPLAHSIAEGNALRIDTPYGMLFHTGDWKLDDTPVIMDPACEKSLRQIGDDGVLVLIGDSTNIFSAETSGSEGDIHGNLKEIVEAQPGRVVVTTFASNVARLQTIGRVARETGRSLVTLGRSMDRIIGAARETGYLKDFPRIVHVDDAGDLAKENMLILCTGCQGEFRAGLNRLALDEHPRLKLSPDDTVIFSSRLIPGNELSVGRLINRLIERDIRVITSHDADIHVSGHPGRADLRALYSWLKPQAVVPVHGEVRHLKRHAEFADELGIKQTLAPKNGKVIRLAPGPLKVIDEIPTGRSLIEGGRVVSSEAPAILERRRMLNNGVMFIALVLDKDLNLIGLPQVMARGLDGFDGEARFGFELIDKIDHLVAETAGKKGMTEGRLAEIVRIAVRKKCRIELKRNPMVDVRTTLIN